MPVKIVKVDPGNPDVKIIRESARLILKGEVLVCPTDTGYAFAANALDEQAISRVFNLKGRSFANPIHVTVSSIEEAKKYAGINESAEKLGSHFLPGALTLVLPRKETIPSLLVGGRNTIGIRIPDNKVILGLAAEAGVPITSTSANISGKPTPYSINEVIEQPDKVIKQIALILDQGELPARGLSTIVDLTASPPSLIRQGVISWEEIERVLGDY